MQLGLDEIFIKYILALDPHGAEDATVKRDVI